jgi:hypothetical protein
MNGLAAYIDSSLHADVGVPTGFETPAASIYTQAEDTTAAFNETKFNDLITSVFEVNGSVNNLTLVANTGLRRTVSDFARLQPSGETSIRDVNYDGGSAQIKLSVELYQSDHGIVSIVNGNPVCMPNIWHFNK